MMLQLQSMVWEMRCEHQVLCIGMASTYWRRSRGERPTDNMFCDSLGLHNYVKIALPKQAASIIADLRLFKQKDQSFANTFKIKECLISILKVGLQLS